MAARTAWTAGNGVGLTWTSCFNSSDLASLGSFAGVMSSLGDIGNDTYLDQYADVAFQLAFASTTLAAGAYFSLYLLDKYNVGGTTYYGDGYFGTGGTKTSSSPNNSFAGTVAASIPGSAQTSIGLIFRGILLPPRPFRFGVQNGLGVALSTATQYGFYVTYNINLNA